MGRSASDLTETARPFHVKQKSSGLIFKVIPNDFLFAYLIRRRNRKGTRLTVLLAASH